MKTFISIVIVIILLVILKILENWERKKHLVGDFSSFDLGCPVKGCGWYFQSKEMLDEHIKNNKHGV